MYAPKYATHENKSEINDFIRQNGFGILVSSGDNSISATHTPMILNREGTELSGHISKANPQWKHFINAKEVLAIFQGPHAYISSSWYDHENVPTWNYIAAHVYGALRIIEGEELLSELKHLVNKYEAHSEQPVSVEAMSADYVQKEMRGIVGFKIAITKIEVSYKLSQNRDRKNFEEIVHQLEKRGDHPSLEVAKAMKNVPVKK
jgi:Transcriptional regulator